MSVELDEPYLFLLALEPIKPAIPVPKRSIVAGSGTGAAVYSMVSLGRKELSAI